MYKHICHITTVSRGMFQLINRTNIFFPRLLLACDQALCIAFAEMHLMPIIVDAEVHVPNYVIL